MEWIDVQKELPKTRKRFLAKCRNGCEDSYWYGIVDVFFDPHVGWIRCESQDGELVFVIQYTEHPCPEWPYEVKMDKR